MYFVVVEVEVVRILIGDVQRELRGGNCSSRWTLVHCSVAHLYFDGQCAQLAALIALTLRLSILRIYIHHRRIFAWNLEDGIRRGSAQL